MRTLTILGVTLLAGVTLMGVSTSCGDGGTKKGKGGAAGSSQKAGDDGDDGDGGDQGEGGKQGGEAGKPGGEGGKSDPSAGGAGKGEAGKEGGEAGKSDGQGGGGTTTTDPGTPLPTDKGLYTAGDFSGYMWTAADKGGSEIYPYDCTESDKTACTFVGDACVAGKVAKIAAFADGGYDYDGTWGTIMGWNLSVADSAAGEDAPNPPADVSSKTSIALALSGTTGLAVRVQLSTVDGSTETAYCKNVTLQNGAATVNLTDLKTKCWGSADNVKFDPASMKPSKLGISFVADKNAEHPFEKACITKLEIN